MAYILHLESSTSVCSVALAKDGQLIDLLESTEGQNHARLMGVYAENILKNNKLSASDLSAVAISEGPGSYTGLRIGVSLAKGICFANEIPLLAISPLQAMSDGVMRSAAELGIELNDKTRLQPMIDARRMEVYTAQYSAENQETKPVTSEIIDETSFLEDLKGHMLYFFGNGSPKCQKLIQHPNARFIPDIRTSAQFMCGLAYQAFLAEKFVDLAYFEPFYLKDFIAGTPKKNVLNS